jgi:hypothetical protein
MNKRSNSILLSIKVWLSLPASSPLYPCTVVWGCAEPAFHSILVGLKAIVVSANVDDRKASGRGTSECRCGTIGFAMLPSNLAGFEWRTTVVPTGQKHVYIPSGQTIPLIVLRNVPRSHFLGRRRRIAGIIARAVGRGL